MPSAELLLPFFAATAIFACVPGPGMLFMAAQTIANGYRAGWSSALGMHLTGYLHIAAAALGFAVLLQAVPVFHTVLKIAGAAYLIWLGAGLIMGSGGALRADARDVAEMKSPPGQAFRDSIAVGILNPKTALFYLAFLPQFTDSSAAWPVWAQIIVLGAVVNLMFSLTDVVCVLASASLVRLFRASRGADRLARRVGGGVLIALGFGLAISSE